MNGQVETGDMDSLVCLFQMLQDVTDDPGSPYRYTVRSVDHIDTSVSSVNVEIELSITEEWRDE